MHLEAYQDSYYAFRRIAVHVKQIITMCVYMFNRSVVSDYFVTPWTVAHQVPLSMEFSRQEYRSGLPFPTPRDLSNSGIKPVSPALAGRFLTTAPSGKLQ